MSAGRRRGTTNAFWSAATVNANDVSPGVQIGRNIDQIIFYIKTGGTATFIVQVAHSGDPTFDGTIDPDALTAVWHDLWYLNGAPAQAVIAVTGATNFALQIPDIVSNWWRLKCTVGVNIVTTAGWEALGDE